MTAKLVLENLKHKPMRSLLSVLLIGVPVTLILSLVGLSHGHVGGLAAPRARRGRRHHRARLQHANRRIQFQRHPPSRRSS